MSANTYNVGDTVFYQLSSRFGGNTRVNRGTVQKVLKTQIKVLGEGSTMPIKFMIETGRIVGEGGSYGWLISEDKFNELAPRLRELRRVADLKNARFNVMDKMVAKLRACRPEAEYQELLAELVKLV